MFWGDSLILEIRFKFLCFFSFKASMNSKLYKPIQRQEAMKAPVRRHLYSSTTAAELHCKASAHSAHHPANAATSWLKGRCTATSWVDFMPFMRYCICQYRKFDEGLVFWIYSIHCVLLQHCWEATDLSRLLAQKAGQRSMVKLQKLPSGQTTTVAVKQLPQESYFLLQVFVDK